HLDPGVGPANRRFLKLGVFLDHPWQFISAKFFVPHSGLCSLINRKLRAPPTQRVNVLAPDQFRQLRDMGRDPARLMARAHLAGEQRPGSMAQSVCGGPSSSLSLAVNAAIRRSASERLRFGLNASSS